MLFSGHLKVFLFMDLGLEDVMQLKKGFSVHILHVDIF